MKVLHLIKTKSYKSDGRLLKWISSLKENNIDSDVYILEDKNKSGKSWVDSMLIEYGKLASRKLFSKHKGYLFKIPEYSFRCLSKYLRTNFNFYVFHDSQHYLTLFLILLFFKNKEKKIIWDLHELPHESLAKYAITRKVVKFLLEHVDLLIYTNVERQKAILKAFKHKESKIVILNNYPSKQYIFHERSNLPLELKEWLDGSPYILWMGLAGENRNFLPVLQALDRFKHKIKVVVMGSIEEKIKKIIDTKYPDLSVYSRFVSQDEIPMYVDNCFCSIVLYKNTSQNNFLCEPNRLYQLVTRGIPVIAGNNPPMKSLVTHYNCGIVLEDDGSDPRLIEDALEKFFDDDEYNKMKKSCLDNEWNELNWETQFANVVNKIYDLKSIM